jgi:hypothetical protein
MEKCALCVICFKPNTVWLDFLRTIQQYDVILIVDDNSVIYSDPDVKIIQIKDEDCKRDGFVDVCYTLNKKISGWDKALYYFSTTNYKFIWFLEDDVFVYNEKTLVDIDSKYSSSDLLTSSYSEKKQSIGWPHWNKIHIKTKPPYYKSMVCAVRMSALMLSKIKMYASTYKTLYFLEALFPTVCKSSNLVYHTPDELKTIVYRKIYRNGDIDKVNLYHPVKDLNKHIEFRK